MSAEQKLAELNAALAKLPAVALKRRDLILALAADMQTGAEAIIADANDPEFMESRYLGRPWYEAMRGVQEVFKVLPATFFLKGNQAGIMRPGPEDDAALKLEALRAAANNGKAH